MFACTANPELEYSFEVDTWSFGQVLFELCTCQTPYQDIDKDDLVETVIVLQLSHSSILTLNPISDTEWRLSCHRSGSCKLL